MLELGLQMTNSAPLLMTEPSKLSLRNSCFGRYVPKSERHQSIRVGYALPCSSTTTGMAAVLQSSTSSGFASPRLSTPRSTFFGLSDTKPLSFGISLSRRSSSSVRRLVSKTLSAKYIREDYLVKKVSAKDVQELVSGERSVPLIVGFDVTWCGPCIIMVQQLEMLAVEYESNALFVKVDTDDEYEFARDMQVRGLPTLYFMSRDPNKDAIRTEGLLPSEMIKNIIDNEMCLRACWCCSCFHHGVV